MGVKIIVVDVYGTLQRMGDQPLTEKTVEVLQKLQAKGVKLAIASGRAVYRIPHYKEVQFDILVGFNGACIEYKGEIIHRDPIPHEDVVKIKENADKMGRAITIATEKSIYGNGSDTILEEYFGFSKAIVPISADFDERLQDDVYQIMMTLKADEYASLLEGTTGTSITAWWPNAVDIIPSSAGKGKAVEKVCELLGIDIEESASFGDGQNDMDMLKATGRGIAMGSATEEVKAIADDVCRGIDEDGIYYYCLEKGWI